MQLGTLLADDLIRLTLPAATWEDVLRRLAEDLRVAGRVHPTYEDAVVARERTFPTGLAVGDIGVAIPHADVEHVREPAIAIAARSAPRRLRRNGEPREHGAGADRVYARRSPGRGDGGRPAGSRGQFPAARRAGRDPERVGLYISTWISPVLTVAAQQAGFKFPAGTTSISSLMDGSSPMTWVLVTAGRFGFAGLAVVLILALLAAWRLRVKPTKAAPVVQVPQVPAA
ncbi:MAG TPA: PTS sugar transporter subunit IIA [bacterium]|nr:PTS sugar transporter subunit IIA [bacterium]